MHFAAEGVEGAQVAGTIGIDGKLVVGNRESPRLCIVRAGGENRRAKRPPVAVAFATFPIDPGRISRPARTREYTAIPRAISERRDRETCAGGYNGSSVEHSRSPCCSSPSSGRKRKRKGRLALFSPFVTRLLHCSLRWRTRRRLPFANVSRHSSKEQNVFTKVMSRCYTAPV